MSGTAIVTIDIQMDYFLGGKFPLFRAKAAAKRAALVLAAGRKRGLHIFHVRHEGLDPKGSFLVAGTPGTALHPALDVPVDGREAIIVKHRPDSFLDTDLEERLRAVGANRVVWMGMMSWMCVDTTVRAAKAKGFDNVLVEDACAAGWLLHHGLPVFPWSSHRAFMAALGVHHAKVVRTKEAIPAL
ncbi:MAG: isochorismatase family protein [Spirochaetaceae bacterium]|nr:isochorismatase family protein [Spirochaetaceae bacterium]